MQYYQFTSHGLRVVGTLLVRMWETREVPEIGETEWQSGFKLCCHYCIRQLTFHTLL